MAKIYSSCLNFFIALLAVGLTSCTTVAPPSAPSSTGGPSWKTREASLSRLQSWQLSGKIAVQTAKDSGSASVDWWQNRGQYAVSLLGPLGTHGMKLSGRSGQVMLETADGKRFTAQNPEQLLAEQWGFHLPVSHLKYWIRGIPVPNLPYSSKFDGTNRLSSLTQGGWNVQFLDYTQTNSVDLPSKLVIQSAALKTKIIIYHWKIGSI